MSTTSVTTTTTATEVKPPENVAPEREASETPRVQVVQRQQPLLIPDVLDHIFQISTNHNLTRAALVCKAWSDVALDWIWRDVKLFSLLKLIYPLNRLDEGWDFKSDEHTGKGNWDRFQSYAKRVVSLTHNDSTDMDSHDSLISYQMMVLLMSYQSTLPDGILLPKAKKITWIAKRDRTPLQLIPFISSPNVQELSVQLSSSVTADSTRRFLFMLSAVPTMRSLKQFHFETKLDVEGDLKFSDALSSVLRAQDSVEMIRLDECYVSTAVMSSVAVRAKLKDVRALVAPLTGDEFQRLTTTMIQSFPQLQRIQLLVPAAFTEPTESIPFRDRFQPLLQCSGLVEFQLFRRHATVLTAADIQAMGKAWPNIEILNLNANVENGQEDGRGTPFRLIEEFAANFSNLKEFAHYYVFDEAAPSTPPTSKFGESLKVLGLGNSPLPDEKVSAVGEYIAAIIPPETLLACSDNGNYRQTVFRTEWNGSSGKQNWVTVKLLVAMERRITALYRTKAEAAMKETHQLKDRVEALESSFAALRTSPPS